MEFYLWHEALNAHNHVNLLETQPNRENQHDAIPLVREASDALVVSLAVFCSIVDRARKVN